MDTIKIGRSDDCEVSFHGSMTGHQNNAVRTTPLVDHPVRTKDQDRAGEPSCFLLETGKNWGLCRLHQFCIVGKRRHIRIPTAKCVT